MSALAASSRAPLPECLLADSHREFFAVCASRVAMSACSWSRVSLAPRYLLRQGAELPADAVLLVEVRGAQLVELADFGVDFDLFHHGGIAGGDGLDFGVGQSAAVEILGGADRGLAAHHLLDEAGLGFQGLPHIGVERAFGDVAVDFDFGIEIALPQNAALALLDVAGPPGRIEMMQRAQGAAARSSPRPSFRWSRSGCGRARRSRR